MALYFDRIAKVIFKHKEVITISGHKIAFEVTKSLKQEENEAKIEIYNLSNDLRKKIVLEESLVQLFAGYVQNQGAVQIGQGTVCHISTAHTKVDIVTRVLFKDGLSNIKNNPLSIAYEKNVNVREVLSKIAKECGLGLKINGDIKGDIKGGFVMLGNMSTELNTLGNSFNFNWSIQNNILVICANKQTITSRIVLLTPKTGLIMNPESIKKVSQSLRKLKDNRQKLNDVNLFKVQALLQSQLQVNDVIAVESNELNGKFRVEKLTHLGDTRGNDWYTDMEVRAI